tara:strand:+ start:187 stop:696 length:510 start_codon:yes stop_codon:yes gene_type:complete
MINITKNNLLKKSKKLFDYLKSNKRTLSSVESCTGGLFSSTLTSIPGSSNVFEFGLVTYSNYSKNKFMNIPTHTLHRFGAVSEETALAMSKNLLKLSKNPERNISISCTGIAGPTGGTEKKPVGTVFISFSTLNKNETFHKKFYNLDREAVRLETVKFMFSHCVNFIEN